MRLKRLTTRTLLMLFVVTIIMAVVLPILFFATLSFASNYEAYRFPARLWPSFSYDAQFTFDEDRVSYMLWIREGGEYVQVKADRMEKRMAQYLSQQLNVEMDLETLTPLLEQAKRTGQPVPVTLKKSMFYNYRVFFKLAADPVRALRNSLEAAAWTILISLLLGGTSGYVMARMSFKLKQGFHISLLVVRMFPVVAISIPMVIYMVQSGLYDTPLSLALVYSIPNIGLTGWITYSIFQGINVELEEAAMVFGATRLRTVLGITLPLALPALVASSLYAFLAAWNDSITALIMTDNNPTLALLVYRTVGAASISNLPAAGAVILLIPSLVFTFIIRKYINQLWGNIAA